MILLLASAVALSTIYVAIASWVVGRHDK